MERKVAVPAEQALGALEFEYALLALPELFEHEALTRAEARRRVGCSSDATMDRHFEPLLELGVVQRHDSDMEGRSRVAYELTEAGRDYATVYAAVESCADRALVDPSMPGAEKAKAVVQAVRPAWSAEVLIHISRQPASAAELDASITGLTYHQVRNILAAMHSLGFTELDDTGANGSYHALSEAGGCLGAPIVAGYRWERNHIPERIGPLEEAHIATVMRMIISRVRVPEVSDGNFALLVDLAEAAPGEKKSPDWYGMVARVRNGAVAGLEPIQEGMKPDAIIGSDPDAWLDLGLTGDSGRLSFKGRKRDSKRLTEAIHRAAINAG